MRETPRRPLERPTSTPRPLGAHICARDGLGWYIEPRWTSERLFEVKTFVGTIADRCCGYGHIPDAAYAAGYKVVATDLVDRGASHLLYPQILDDSVATESALGIAAGLAWLRFAEAMVAYVDYGISPGVRAAVEAVEELSLPIERRWLVVVSAEAREACHGID